MRLEHMGQVIEQSPPHQIGVGNQAFVANFPVVVVRPLFDQAAIDICQKGFFVGPAAEKRDRSPGSKKS